LGKWKKDSPMPERCRFLALLCSLACFSAFAPAANLHAQTSTGAARPSVRDDAGDSDDDSEDEPVSSLFVSLRLDESSHVFVNATLFASKDKQPGGASIKSALEATSRSFAPSPAPFPAPYGSLASSSTNFSPPRGSLR
jgi:hypothetical protein